MTTPMMRLGALLVLALSLTAAPAAAQGPVQIGTVVQQRGSVTVLRGADPAILRLGAPVFLGDRVVTGSQARIRIELSDRSVLAIGADSDVALTEQATDRAGNPVSNVVSLLYGIVRATVRSIGPERRFDIQTQLAVASARSTDWLVESLSDRTSVFVVDGEVSVTAQGGGSVDLTAGLGTDVIHPGGRALAVALDPTPPAAWSAERRDAALARTQVP